AIVIFRLAAISLAMRYHTDAMFEGFAAFILKPRNMLLHQIQLKKIIARSFRWFDVKLTNNRLIWSNWSRQVDAVTIVRTVRLRRAAPAVTQADRVVAIFDARRPDRRSTVHHANSDAKKSTTFDFGWRRKIMPLQLECLRRQG